MRKTLALLAVLMLSASAVHARAVLTEVRGEAWVESAAVRRPARSGAAVAPGERVVTGRNGSVSALLSDASRIEIRPNTSVIVEKGRAATTAVAVREGSVRVRTSAYRWPQEAFQVTTPTVTTGVRGTVFEVSVAGTGDGHLYVEQGLVTARDSSIPAGAASFLTVDGPSPPAPAPDPVASRHQWQVQQWQRMANDRRKIFESLAGLLRAAIEQRLRIGAVVLATMREIGEAQKTSGEDPATAGVARLGRLITAIRNGAEQCRTILVSDREAALREEILKGLVAAGEAPPGALAAARAALDAAARERQKRNRDLAALDQTLDQLSSALVFIASAAAADPSGDRSAGRIISEGLGLPMASLPLPEGGIRLERRDLGWEAGASWTAMRVLRGREDYRVPVRVHLASAGAGWMLTKTPEAFDTPLMVHLIPTDTAIWIDRWEGVPQITARRPALLYRFPMTLGDTWVAWQFFPGPQGGWRIERRVTACERIRTPFGSFDCLRLETRLRQGRNVHAPLISTEWIAPDRGVVREISFRHEIRSMSWEERIPDGAED